MAIVQLALVAGVNADAYFSNLAFSPTDHVVVINEQPSWHGKASNLTETDTSDLLQITGNTYLCESDTSSPCSSSSRMDSTSLLPVCESALQTNCVVSMSLGTSALNMQPSTFIGMAPGPTTKGDEATGLIAGSTVGYWTNPILSSSGTNTYMTNVNLYSSHDYPEYACNQAAGRSFGFVRKTPKIWKVCNLSASILPYSVKSGGYLQHSFQNYQYSGQQYVSDMANYPGCVWTTGTACDVLQDFPAGTIASMTLRVSNGVGGWFRGRLQNPSLSVSAFDKKTNLITITAQTVTVPRLNVVFPSNSTDPSVLLFCSHANQCTPTSYSQSAEDAWQSFTVINDLRDFAKNSASGVNTEWSFGSYAVADSNNCLTNTSSILGIVTTNSMAYESHVPIFYQGEFSYGVAGMHYMPDGLTPFKGIYDMVMADSVARCLYNFSSAPISGSVTVTDDSGSKQNIATTSVSDIGGWLHLAAYNFLFSNPTITVKLTQASTPTTTSTVKKVVSKTIICVKGKLIRKFTGTSPKCPSGYALKK